MRNWVRSCTNPEGTGCIQLEEQTTLLNLRLLGTIQLYQYLSSSKLIQEKRGNPNLTSAHTHPAHPEPRTIFCVFVLLGKKCDHLTLGAAALCSSSKEGEELVPCKDLCLYLRSVLFFLYSCKHITSHHMVAELARWSFYEPRRGTRGLRIERTECGVCVCVWEHKGWHWEKLSYFLGCRQMEKGIVQVHHWKFLYTKEYGWILKRCE